MLSSPESFHKHPLNILQLRTTSLPPLVHKPVPELWHLEGPYPIRTGCHTEAGQANAWHVHFI